MKSHVAPLLVMLAVPLMAAGQTPAPQAADEAAKAVEAVRQRVRAAELELNQRKAAAFLERQRAQAAIEDAQQRQRESARLIQGFSIVLVQGSLQATSSTTDLPKVAQRALADMKDFLPYKGYGLLDTGWILGPGQVSEATSRLRGASGQDLTVTLSAEASDTPGSVQVRFLLGAVEGPSVPVARVEAAARQHEALAEQRAGHEFSMRQLKERYGDNHPAVVGVRAQLVEIERQIARLEQSKAFKGVSAQPPPPLIDTVFTMRVGETVVVGTSRVAGGDTALIALLTAVPRSGK